MCIISQKSKSLFLTQAFIDLLPFLTVCEVSEIVKDRIYIAFEAFANKRQYIKIKHGLEKDWRTFRNRCRILRMCLSHEKEKIEQAPVPENATI